VQNFDCIKIRRSFFRKEEGRGTADFAVDAADGSLAADNVLGIADARKTEVGTAFSL
jgi:hypothetical protein